MDGRRQYIGKFFGSETREKFRPSIHHAGYRGRIDSMLGHFVFALAVKKFDGKLSGRPAAGVEPIQFSSLRFVNDDEQVAAHSVHHGLHDAHHGVRGDRGINRVATPRQNHRASLRSQRAFGGHDSATRHNHGSRLRSTLRVGSESRHGYGSGEGCEDR